jgi:hypothetical protein
MKKLVYLFSFLMLSSILLWTSCEEDPIDPGDLTPTINFKGGEGYISTDATLFTDEPFTIGITATNNATSGANLALLEITRTFNNAVWFSWDTTINVAFFNIDVNMQAINVEGTERVSFKVTDKDGYSEEIGVNITTEIENQAGPINSFDQKILGSYGNVSTGSSFASIDGSVYSLAEAKVNQTKVDWMYFYGATLFATLAAPDDAQAATVFNNATNGLQTWTTKNATRFKKVTTAYDWATITDDSIIVLETASGVDQSKFTSLAVGDLLAFTTVSGKSGMIRINAIVTGSDGTIDISVKVQQ